MDMASEIHTRGVTRQLCSTCVFLAVGVDPREHSGEECIDCPIIKNDGYHALAMGSMLGGQEPLSLEKSQYKSEPPHENVEIEIDRKLEHGEVNIQSDTNESPSRPGCLWFVFTVFLFLIIIAAFSYISPIAAINVFIFGSLALIAGYMAAWGKYIFLKLNIKKNSNSKLILDKE